jgi:hypothetical protein
MNIALWIIAGLLAAGSLGSGAMKLARPKEKLAASGMGWVEDFSAGTVKAIGTLEVLAAVGLILPAALGIAPVLVPLAALGLVVLMAGAILTPGCTPAGTPVRDEVALAGGAAPVARRSSGSEAAPPGVAPQATARSRTIATRTFTSTREDPDVNSPGNKQQSHRQTPSRRHEHRRSGAHLADDRRGLRARREAAHPI